MGYPNLDVCGKVAPKNIRCVGPLFSDAFWALCAIPAAADPCRLPVHTSSSPCDLRPKPLQGNRGRWFRFLYWCG